MSFEFVFDQSPWFIIVCLLLGMAVAWLTYFNAKSKAIFNRPKTWLLATLRTLSFFLIFYLLFAPLLRYLTREVEKPVVVLLQDNSQSLVLNSDSAYYRNEYQKQVQAFESELGDDFIVETFDVGNEVKDTAHYTFTDKQTDLSQAIESVESGFFNRNLGAVILASDGIYNRGNNPLYAAFPFQSPLFTVALGETEIRKDLFIAKVNHNPLAFLNNDFPIEVLVQAKKLKGEVSSLSITHKGAELATKAVNISDETYFESFQFLIPAREVGLQRYEVKLKTISGEFSTENNITEVFIEVVDGRQKVLILADGVHADVGAIKQALQANQTIEVESALVNDFKKNLKNYSLVILHQLPSKTNASTKIIEEATDANIPLWIIVGEQSNWLSWNKLNLGFSLQNFRNDFNVASATYNEGFGLFTLSDDLLKAIKTWPPLDVPYGEIKLQADVNVFFKQKIGNVATNFPLMAFQTRGNQKIAYLMGEGIWRWRLQNYANNRSHQLFNELVSKVVQFLSLKLNKNRFIVQAKRSIYENERMVFDAELYNESYETVKNAEIALTLIDESKKEYQYTFSKSENNYRLDVGLFAPGVYNYLAKTTLNGAAFESKGQITVKPLKIEQVNTTADHSLLFSLAEKHRGKMFLKNQWKELAQAIKNNPEIKSISFSQSSLNDWINLKWLFFIAFILLATEWFLRRLNGSY